MGRKLVDGQQFPSALTDAGNFKVAIVETVAPVIVTATIAVTGLEELPTAAVAWRGHIALLKGGEGVADTLYICVKLDTDEYDWVNLTQFTSW